MLDTEKAKDPADTFTTNALLANFPTGAIGAVGVVMSEDGEHLIVSHAERAEKETGGREFTVIEGR